MRQKPLTKEQREMLENSPYVMKLTDVYVFFKSSFINKFCVDYHAGKTADSIFLEAGIDPKIHNSIRSSIWWDGGHRGGTRFISEDGTVITIAGTSFKF